MRVQTPTLEYINTYGYGYSQTVMAPGSSTVADIEQLQFENTISGDSVTGVE